MIQLRQDCDERTKELAEAREFKSRLLTVMGTVGHNPMNVNHSKARTSTSIEYTQDIQRLNAESQYWEAEIDPVRSFESSTSSRSGPTPKRNKRRQSLNSPLTQPTRAMKGTSRGKSLGNTALKSRKQPLKDLSLNTKTAEFWNPAPSQCRNSQDQYGSPSMVTKENDTDDLAEDAGDTSFGSDVFTSTNQQKFNEFGDRMPGYTYDETTVDC